MPIARDITGQQFGDLIAEALIDSRTVGHQKKRFWRCRCKCGRTTEASQGNLTQGKVRSCGCAWRRAIVRHGKYKTPEYKIWAAMLDRCRNPHNPSFKEYGGRGITVCATWLRFEKFDSDMGRRPESAQLDRIDVNGAYLPSNCRWASAQDQANNRRTNRKITFNGESLTVAQWARRSGLTKSALLHRLKAEWTLHDAIHTPLRSIKR